MFAKSSFNKSALVLFVISVLRLVVNAESAFVRLVVSAARLVAIVFSAAVALVASEARLVVKVVFAVVRFVVSVTKLAAIVFSDAMALAISVVKAVALEFAVASTYIFTDFTDGYLISEAPSVLKFVDLFDKSSFKFKAIRVLLLMGLSISLVLSTF